VDAWAQLHQQRENASASAYGTTGGTRDRPRPLERPPADPRRSRRLETPPPLPRSHTATPPPCGPSSSSSSETRRKTLGSGHGSKHWAVSGASMSAWSAAARQSQAVPALSSGPPPICCFFSKYRRTTRDPSSPSETRRKKIGGAPEQTLGCEWGVLVSLVGCGAPVTGRPCALAWPAGPEYSLEKISAQYDCRQTPRRLGSRDDEAQAGQAG